MTRNLQHFVLTRFNVASAGRESSIRNSPGWLDRRFDLFETYCLPSMAAQEPGTFTWLIYFDEQTPAEFRARIAEAQKTVPFEAIFVGLFHRDLAVQHVTERLKSPDLRIVTTRLDNDDAVSNDYLRRVRDVAETVADGTVINFREGVALKDGCLYTARDDSNPFASLVEAGPSPKTIWAATHTELQAIFAFRQVVTAPCWLQVVHGENVANRIKGKRLGDQAVMARFSLAGSVNIRATSGAALLVDLLAIYPVRRAREAVRAIARYVLRRH